MLAANPDMVGHTGDLMATKVACEITDKCVGELLEVSAFHDGRACRATRYQRCCLPWVARRFF